MRETNNSDEKINIGVQETDSLDPWIGRSESGFMRKRKMKKRFFCVVAVATIWIEYNYSNRIYARTPWQI